MNAFFYFRLLICGITLQICQSLPHRELWSKYDARRSNQKITDSVKNVGNIKSDPKNVQDFLLNRLGWFPSDAGRNPRNFDLKPRSQQLKRKRQTWHFAIMEIPQECEPPSKAERMKQKIRQKIKQISSNYNIPKNWSEIKSQSVESISKFKNYIKNANIKEKLKNITHPLRYKGPKCYSPSGSEAGNDVSYLHIHPKSSHVEKIPGYSTTESPSINSLVSATNAMPMLLPHFPPLTQYNVWEMPNLSKPSETANRFSLKKLPNPVGNEDLTVPAIRTQYQLSPKNTQFEDRPKYLEKSQTGRRLHPFLHQTLKDVSASFDLPQPIQNLSKFFEVFPSSNDPRLLGVRPVTAKQTLPQSIQLHGNIPSMSKNLAPKSQLFSPSQIEQLPPLNEIPPPFEFPKFSKTMSPSSTLSSNSKNLLPYNVRSSPLLKLYLKPDYLSQLPSLSKKPLPSLPSPFENLSSTPQLRFKSSENPFAIPESSKTIEVLSVSPSLSQPLKQLPLKSFEIPASLAFSRLSKSLPTPSANPLPVKNSFETFEAQQSYRKSSFPSEIQFLSDEKSKPYRFSVPLQKPIHHLKFPEEFPSNSLDQTDLPELIFPNLPESPHFFPPKKIKLVVELKNPKTAARVERNADQEIYLASLEGDNTNSTHVLETAGEMASDLAGRVTNLWHCVLGSHRVPDTKDVRFFLYTRRNVIQPELLDVNYDLINKKLQAKPQYRDIDCVDLSPEEIEDFERISDKNRNIIRSNYLNIRAPTKILIHGYTGSYKDGRMAKIKDAYLSKGRYNVIQVDWEVLAAPPCYIRVTHHSKFVGETIAQLLNGLFMVGVNMSLVHLVGFSLGAQVAGFTGNNSTIVPICRITGLDPALPLFLHTQPSGHLDKLDAKFVDVIHTCGGILAMLDPLGHVDFYPNGGTRQPGCEFSNLKCSHSRAPQYFAESVNSVKKFTGQLCLTWEEFVAGDCDNSSAYMGEPCSRKSTFGKYYLLTKSKEPFVL